MPGGIMLTLVTGKQRFCDGMSRRSFLQIGSLALGGLSLPGLLQAEQHSGRGSRRSVIMVYLSGGLSHHDSFDLKPNAPREIAGEFRPIATRVPGIQIGELLPRLAGMMDKLAIVRSVVGQRDEHSSFQSLTGYTMDLARREGRPNVCSVIARTLRQTAPTVPAFVDLFPTMQHRPYNIPGPGFAGPAFAGAKVENDGLGVMRLRDLTVAQFQDRRRLLQAVDGLRRGLDNAQVERMNTSYRQAFEVLTSNRLVEAWTWGANRGRSATATATVRHGTRATGRRCGTINYWWPGAWWRQGCAASRWPTASGTRTARTSATCAVTCQCSTAAFRRWSRTCTSAAWTAR